jgi:hypothetical protein
MEDELGKCVLFLEERFFGSTTNYMQGQALRLAEVIGVYHHFRRGNVMAWD